MREDKDKKDGNKKRLLLVLLFVVATVTIFIADDRQQAVLEKLKSGYRAMENKEYVQAGDAFEEYLAAHDSALYWKLIELFNGKDSRLTRDNVESALSKCRSKDKESNKKDIAF